MLLLCQLSLGIMRMDQKLATKHIPTEDITSPLRLSSTLPGVEIALISARQVAPRSDNFNMTSTIHGNISIIGRYFNGMTIRCGTIQTRDSVIVPVNITENGESKTNIILLLLCAYTYLSHDE